MYLGQEKSFMFLRFKLAKSRGLQCYDDKLVQIRIETIYYQAPSQHRGRPHPGAQHAAGHHHGHHMQGTPEL